MPAVIVPVPCYAIDCRVLRWTQCQGAPATITDINGSIAINPDSLGPPGWYLPGFDDSAWTTPVVVSDVSNPTGNTFEPGVLRPHLLGFGDIAGGADLVLEGDPIWISEPESDNMATMLVRWRFTTPAGEPWHPYDPLAGPVIGLFRNFAGGQIQVDAFSGAGTRYYLNLPHPLGFLGFDHVLGQDAISGYPYLGRIVAGQENLMCMALSAPYRGPGCSLSRAISQSYFIHDLICLYEGAPIGGTGSTTLAWGYNGFGQLGVGDNVDKYVPTLLATDVTFEQVVGCRSTSWGRTIDGAVYAWGHGGAGQLGNGFNSSVSNPVPILLDTIGGVTRLAAGGDTEDNGRCFALVVTGDLYGWGDNRFGALGDGTTVQRLTPVLVNTDVLRFASGGAHTVIIKTDGSVLATGRGTSGQLGNGFSSSTGWVTVTPSVGGLVADVACGVNTTWVLMADGHVYGSGQSNLAQVGFPTGNFGTWTWIPIDNVVAIATSGNTLYMLRENGEAWAQGSNIAGALGTGNPSAFGPVARMVVPTGVTFTQIPDSHPVFGPAAIALGSDALAYTWGDGTVGQRGSGAPGASAFTPVVVPALTGVRWVGGGAAALFADTGGAPVVTTRGRSWAQVVG